MAASRSGNGAAPPRSTTCGLARALLTGGLALALLVACTATPAPVRGAGDGFQLSLQTTAGWLEGAGSVQIPASAAPATGLRIVAPDRIRYRVYAKGSGWGPWRESGACAGCAKAGITAVQVQFPRPFHYRAHVPGTGWLAWVGMGTTTGKEDGPAIDGFEIQRTRGPYYPTDRLAPRWKKPAHPPDRPR